MRVRPWSIFSRPIITHQHLSYIIPWLWNLLLSSCSCTPFVRARFVWPLRLLTSLGGQAERVSDLGEHFPAVAAIYILRKVLHTDLLEIFLERLLLDLLLRFWRFVRLFDGLSWFSQVIHCILVHEVSVRVATAHNFLRPQQNMLKLVVILRFFFPLEVLGSFRPLIKSSIKIIRIVFADAFGDWRQCRHDVILERLGILLGVGGFGRCLGVWFLVWFGRLRLSLYGTHLIWLFV